MTPFRNFPKPILAAALVLAVAVPAGAAEPQGDSLLAARLAQSYVVGDLTGDGIADIAVVDFLSDTLAVLVGEGRGGFRRAASMRVGAGPRAVVASDFNGDGRPDLAVASFLAGQVTIFAGTGSGQFGKPVVTTRERGLSALVAGDFTGDGAADLVCANYLTGEVELLAGTGSGALLEPMTIGRLAGPTRILARQPGPYGRAALTVLDASGASAWQLDGDGNGAFSAPVPTRLDTAASSEEAGAASHQDAVGRRAWRIRAVSGDGAAAIAGSASPHAFVVEVLDEAGTPVAEREVAFTRLFPPGGATAARTEATDADGQARIESALSKLPDNVFIAVAGEGAEGIVLAATTALPPEKLVALMARSLPASSAEAVDILDRLQWHLNRGDDVQAVVAIVALLGLQGAEAGDQDAAARRTINQLMLFGSPAADCVELTCDVPVNGTIASVTETDFLCLSVADGETLEIAIANTGGAYGYDPQWRILTAAGTPAAACGAWSGAGATSCGPFPAAGGPYRIQVADGARDATGTYQAYVYSLAAATACEVTGALTCDTPLDGAIGARTDIDLFNVPVADGDTLRVVMANTGGTYGYDPAWRLVTPAGTPAAICGTWVGAGEYECGPLPAGLGPYRLQIRDWGIDATGTYQLYIYSLAASTACEVTGALTCDTPLDSTIGARTDIDLFNVPVADGDTLRVVMANTGGTYGYDPAWRLITPAGTPAAICGTWVGAGEYECGPLPAGLGPYRLQIQDWGHDATGTYQLYIYSLAASTACEVTGALACDTPVDGTLGVRTDIDLFNVPVADGDTLRVVMANTGGTYGYDPAWRLITPAGTPAATCGAWVGAGEYECGPLPAGLGPYRLQIQDSGHDATGSYQLYIYSLAASTACEVTGALACDTAMNGTLGSRTDIDLYSVPVADGDTLRVVMANTGGAYGYDPAWRLITPAGTPAAICGTWVGAGEYECGPLPAGLGPYRLQIQDSGHDATGTYQLYIYSLAASTACEVTGALACDTPVDGTLGGRTDIDLFNVPVADGDRVQVAMVNTGGSYGYDPYWRLLTPAGSPAAICGTWAPAGEYECGPLPASGGPYRLEVLDANHDATGTYQLYIYSLDSSVACEAIGLTCSSPTNGRIDARTDMDLYRFSVAAGDTMEIAVVNTGGAYGYDPQWRLLAPAGTPAPICGTWRGPGVVECGPLPASDNPYRIQIKDGSRDATGTYQINITSLVMGCAPPDLVVTSVTDPPAIAVLKQAFRITDTTKNQGAGAAPSSRTRYYLSLDEAKSGTDKRLGAGRVVPALPAGTSSTGAKNVVVPPTTKLGLYFLLACADDTQVVDEGGVLEANNCRASTTKVEVRAPDLIVSAMTNPPETIARGGSFLAVETVRNLGNADTTATATTRFYLSLDPKKSGTDLLLTGTRAVGPLAVGGASAGNTTVGVPPTAVPNSYFLLACADDLKKVAEANTALTGEKNNCLASTTKVTVSP